MKRECRWLLHRSIVVSRTLLYLSITALIHALVGPATAWAQGAIVVATPAKAGVVEGRTENSDAFIWYLLTQFASPVDRSRASPVRFETWASDEDTFSASPHWPGPNEPKKFHESVLEVMKALPTGVLEPMASLLAGSTNDSCKAPGNAAVGGFPTTGDPTPCIAEEVKRNRAQFDYIVNNHLNTQAGLAAAFAKSLKVEMPLESIAIKVDWVPLNAMRQWIPQLNKLSNGEIEKLYYTTTVTTTVTTSVGTHTTSLEYALVSMHVSSRQNPNWVWGTFEHQLNPGRCDSIGCLDSFGAETPKVVPNTSAVNTQYGACHKTQQLKNLMASEKLSPVWDNYCLKSSQVDYAASDGTPYVLGNSVIEGIVGNGTVAASSCISCHAYASFGPAGKTLPGVRAMLPFNPTGRPIPGVLAGSSTFAFMWGVLLAP